ncbi:MAG: alpha/beta fold hydrolase [Acidobacteriota bacterium]|nr:alpha/beta fold hydrolase [Acidobacteriota bacterium]
MKAALRVLAVAALLIVTAGAVFYLRPLWVADQQIRFHLWREGVKSKYVEAGGYRLHYFETGPPAGTPLVLVHGLGARGEDWAAMLAPLAAQGFHIYAPDLLGYGRSPKPDVDYSISLEEQTVVKFMQAVHVPRSDVGGWSMGGWIAMKLAIDHPELVDRLVIYDSAGVYFPATFAAELFTPTDVAGLNHLMAMLTPKPIKMPAFAANDAVRKLQRNAWVINRSMAAMTNGRDLLDFQLYRITEPMLVVWGAQDELIPVAVGERIHKSVPQSALRVVEGCGHLAPAECAAPVVASTVEFLKAQPPIVGGEKTLASQ